MISCIASTTPTNEQIIKDLRFELSNLRSMYTQERMRRAIAETNAARLRAKDEKPLTIPWGDSEFGYECGNPDCNCPITEEFAFCPRCGREIDWRTWVDTPQDESAFDMAGDR